MVQALRDYPVRRFQNDTMRCDAHATSQAEGLFAAQQPAGDAATHDDGPQAAALPVEFLAAIPVPVLLIKNTATAPENNLVCVAANAAAHAWLGLADNPAVGLTVDALPALARHAPAMAALSRTMQPGPLDLPLSSGTLVVTAVMSTDNPPLPDHERLLCCTILPARTAKATAPDRAGDLCAVTNLPGRVPFCEMLDTALEAGNSATVLAINIDRFRQVNELLGRDGGDVLLRQVADRISGALRTGDIFARLEDDRFGLAVAQQTTTTNAQTLAERLHGLVSAPFLIGEQELFITLTIGVRFDESGGAGAASMLADAEAALLAARARGRGSTHCFDADSANPPAQGIALENDLRRALAEDQLHLAYQPIINLQTGQLDGFEALARWEHPEIGPVPPTEFIPIAEESGLIVPLGRWALETASAQLASWRGEFPSLVEKISMAVNVSAMQFSRDDLLAAVKSCMERHQLKPHQIKIELTESALLDQAELAVAKLRELNAFGVKIALDDFGTGYSSLSYLQRLKLDVIKIDRSFVTDMLSTRDNFTIVRTILSLAQTMSLETVAEGIETREQADLLRGLGCNFGQGYFFSRPVLAGKARDLLHVALRMERGIGS